MEKGQEIVVQDIQAQTAPVSTSATLGMVMMMEKLASNPNVDVGKMKEILSMQKEVLDREAGQLFAAAFAKMQVKLPEIVERGKAHTGKYATLEDINDAVKPILAEHGFGISFRVNQDDAAGKVKVIGILSHEGGHSESTEMSVPLETSGSKNNVQAVGSSVSYARRYVLCALLNISTRGEDDDGASTGKAPTEAQISALKKLLMNSTSEAQTEFTKKYGSLTGVKAAQVDILMAWFKKRQVKNANN